VCNFFPGSRASNASISPWSTLCHLMRIGMGAITNYNFMNYNLEECIQAAEAHFQGQDGF